MIQLKLNRQTGEGTLEGLSQKVEEIASATVSEQLSEELINQIVQNLLLDEMAIQNAIGNTLRAGIQFLLGSDGPGDIYFRSASGPLARLGIGANGQQLIVDQGLPAWADRSALSWSVVTATSQAASVNTGYLINASALSTITLPPTAVVGSLLEIVGMGAGGWRLAQAAGQQVIFGNIPNTAGTAGQLNSTHQRDCVRLVCIVANTTWQVISSIGNIDVI